MLLLCCPPFVLSLLPFYSSTLYHFTALPPAKILHRAHSDGREGLTDAEEDELAATAAAVAAATARTTEAAEALAAAAEEQMQVRRARVTDGFGARGACRRRQWTYFSYEAYFKVVLEVNLLQYYCSSLRLHLDYFVACATVCFLCGLCNSLLQAPEPLFFF